MMKITSQTISSFGENFGTCKYVQTIYHVASLIRQMGMIL